MGAYLKKVRGGHLHVDYRMTEYHVCIISGLSLKFINIFYGTYIKRSYESWFQI